MHELERVCPTASQLVFGIAPADQALAYEDDPRACNFRLSVSLEGGDPKLPGPCTAQVTSLNRFESA